MPTDATYFPGVYKPQGDQKLVVGALGRISMATGAGSQVPTTGTLGANVSSATLTGNDWSGSIAVQGGGTAVAANTNICVVTFAVPRATAPLVFLTVLGLAAAYAGSFAAVVTTTGWTLINSAAFGISQLITVGYHLIDIE